MKSRSTKTRSRSTGRWAQGGRGTGCCPCGGIEERFNPSGASRTVVSQAVIAHVCQDRTVPHRAGLSSSRGLSSVEPTPPRLSGRHILSSGPRSESQPISKPHWYGPCEGWCGRRLLCQGSLSRKDPPARSRRSLGAARCDRDAGCAPIELGTAGTDVRAGSLPARQESRESGSCRQM